MIITEVEVEAGFDLDIVAQAAGDTPKEEPGKGDKEGMHQPREEEEKRRYPRPGDVVVVVGTESSVGSHRCYDTLLFDSVQWLGCYYCHCYCWH